MEAPCANLYKIGAISRMLGIPEHVLRFYETKGVLTAKHKGASPVRYYDEFDINILIQARQLRGLGFGVDEIRELLHQESAAADIEYYDLLARKLRETEDEISRLRKSAAELERLKDSLRLNERARGQVRTCMLPDLYWIYSMDEKRSPQSLRQDEDLSRAIMDLFNPSFRKVALVEASDDAQGEDVAFHYAWGIAIDADQLHLVPQRHRSCLTALPGGRYEALGNREDHACILSQDIMHALWARRVRGDRPCMFVELLPGGYTNYLVRCGE